MTAPYTHLVPSVRSLRPSATLAINERSNALKDEGREVFKLGLGQSPFPVPETVRASLERHAGEKDYLPVRGLPALRHAIKEWHHRRDGIDAMDRHVIVGPGSKELLFILQLVHDSRLTIPSPSWVSYAPQAQILEKDVDWVETQFDNGWNLTAEALENVCKQDPTQPRLLILNYPNNPTGMSYSADALSAIARVARAYRVVIISDEIYGEVDHGHGHTSMAEFYPEGTIVSSGLSKWCGAGGWRLGYCIFPDALKPLADAMAAVASETFTSVSAPIQYAAVEAFLDTPSIQQYLHNSRRILGALGNWIGQRLTQAGLRVHTPQGGFYIFPDFEPLRKKLAKRGVYTSAALTEVILDETGVACLPGVCFGRRADELTVRLSFVDFDGTRALQYLGSISSSKSLSQDDIQRLCPPTVTAIQRLAEWCEALV